MWLHFISISLLFILHFALQNAMDIGLRGSKFKVSCYDDILYPKYRHSTLLGQLLNILNRKRLMPLSNM